MIFQVAEPPCNLGLNLCHACGTKPENKALRLLLSEYGVLLSDGLLKRRNEVALGDRDHQRELDLCNDAHEWCVAQRHLRGRLVHDRIVDGHGKKITPRPGIVKYS